MTPISKTDQQRRLRLLRYTSQSVEDEDHQRALRTDLNKPQSPKDWKRPHG